MMLRYSLIYGCLSKAVFVSVGLFLGAFAYAGAGGNLNLAQSFYVKEKGYGMGKFSGRITSILTGKKEKITLEGTTFECNEKNLKYFKTWWKTINIEHSIIFWLTGAFTMIILSLLAYTTVFGKADLTQGVTFVIAESKVIGNNTFSILGTIFLIISSLMLFSTQFSVMDATSRIMSENLVILSPKKFKIENLSKYFYIFLWVQIAAGIIIFSSGLTQPLTLIIIGAALNAVAMFIYSGLMLWLNTTNLEKPLRPSLIRKLVIGSAFIFYGVFSFFTILQNI